jgi:branched-chain amino acid transport system permease protein
MVTGLIFVICVLAFRRGVVGEAVALMQRLGRRRMPAAPPTVSADGVQGNS